MLYPTVLRVSVIVPLLAMPPPRITYSWSNPCALRVRDGKVDTFKVVHTVKDGVVREKVVIQDGNGLEIIRNGNEVHCFLPDRESVLVEEWNNQSTLFSTLPSSDIRFGSEYDLLIKDFERVAGRRSCPLEPIDDAGDVALRLQATEEPSAAIGKRFVVDVDGVLRREDQAETIRARLLEQREQRALRWRLGDRRLEARTGHAASPLEDQVQAAVLGNAGPGDRDQRGDAGRRRGGRGWSSRARQSAKRNQMIAASALTPSHQVIFLPSS